MKRTAAVLMFMAFSFCLASAQDRAARPVDAVVADAVAFLRKAQAADGSFSADRNIGVTAIVLTGVLKSGGVQRDDPLVAKAFGAIEKLVNKKEGHIAGKDPRQGLKNYVTSVNMLAFAAGNDKGQYEEILKDSAKFLKGLQWDEGESIAKSDPKYGGFGYDSKNRPDMSNSSFAMDALKAAGIKPGDESFQKAIVFVSRSQNLKSEHQDQPWADKINDGSFIYNPLETKADEKANEKPDNPRPGYASMTYAGVKSLIYAGVDKNDARVQAALKWIRNNYSVDENVGMPPGKTQQGYYYYLHTMAKCLDALGLDEIEDAKGIRHNWRHDIAQALAKRQRPDGSWANETDRWMEGDPNLATGFALMTLSYCKPAK